MASSEEQRQLATGAKAVGWARCLCPCDTRHAAARQLGLLGLLVWLLCGMDAALAKQPATTDNHDEAVIAESIVGLASYYSDKFQGRRTASHERYDKNALTAASNQFPLETRVRVTNLKNKKSVVVRINDRMVEGNPRLIDVSRRAATELGFHRTGVARVKVEVLPAVSSESP